MELIVIGLIVVFWLLCGTAAAVIANSKGANGGLYFLFGIMFGPFGVLGSLFASGKTCPFCHSRIYAKATVCPRCYRDLAASMPPSAEELKAIRVRVIRDRIGIVCLIVFFIGIFIIGAMFGSQ